MDSLTNSTKSTPASRSWGGFFYDVAVSTVNFINEHPYTTALIVGGVVAAGVGAYPYFFGSATAAAAALPNPAVLVASPDAVVSTLATATAAKATTAAKAATAVKVTAATAVKATAAKAAVATAATAATVAAATKAVTAATAATANRPDLTLQQICGSFKGITLPQRVTDLFADISVPSAVTQELCPNSPQFGAILVVTMAFMSYIAASITNTTDPVTIQQSLETVFRLMDASDTFRRLSVDDQALVMECAIRTFYAYLGNDLDLPYLLPRLNSLFAGTALENLPTELVIKMQPACSGAMREILSGGDRDESLIIFFRKFRG